MPTTSEVNTAASNFIADTNTADAKINGVAGNVTDRHGTVTKNLEQIFEDIGYDVPVTFASGLSPTSGRFTVDHNGNVYAAKPSEIPFTTTASFDASQWVLIVGQTDFSNVNSVRNNSTPSYTAGVVLFAKAENISWVVAASGATDHHCTTSGGVKLYVSETPIVDARAFFILGGIDETANLEALRQHAISYPGTIYDFRNIATKELQYTAPKWLAEVQDVTVDLRGISLRNLGAGTYGYSDMDAALVLGSGPYFHDDQGTGQIDPANAESGHLFSDADAGDTSIALVTAGEDVNYQPGDRVLLRWLERQGAASFPPNPGYFEWLTVESVASGTITFTAPLRHGYRAQAPDYTSGSYYLVSNGKARILNLTRSGYTEAGTIRILGGKGVDTGSGTVGYRGALVVEGAARVEVYDGEFEAFFNNCCEYNLLQRCKFPGGTTELDKIVGRIECIDTHLDGVSQGTGVEFFSMKGGKLTGAVQMRMKNIALDEVEIQADNTGGTMISMDQYPRQSVDVQNCHITPQSASTSVVQVGNTVNPTPDAITQTLITINTGNAVYSDMVRNIQPGNVLTLNNGKPPEHFYVTGFRFDGSGNLLIDGFCEVASPSAGQRVMWFAQKFRQRNNHVYNAPDKFRMLSVGRRVWHVESGDDGRVVQTQVMRWGEYTTLSVNCYVSRVSVDVVKPYTGSDASCVCACAVQGAGAAQHFIDANAKTAGHRAIDMSGQYGAQAGDTLTALPNQTWCEDIIIHLNGDGGTGTFTDGDLADLPLIRVTIEGMKPPFDALEM